MGKVKTTEWDPADSLDTEEKMALYLEAALEEDDPALLAAALGDIARAKGMSEIARETGLGRESLYKALSQGARPRYETINAVLHALGVKFMVVAEQPQSR